MQAQLYGYGVTPDEQLIAFLNSRRRPGGELVDDLADPGRRRAWATEAGLAGSDRELVELLELRPVLRAVIERTADPAALKPWLEDVVQVPSVTTRGVSWRLSAGETPAVALILAWSRLADTDHPRLRQCARPACRGFFVDRSHANNRRWCAMAVCGNRTKVQRFRNSTPS